MKRTNGKGDVRTLGAPGTAGTGDHSGPGDDRASDAQAQSQRNNKALSETLTRLAMRDDGYLRLIPNGDGDRVFIKWKFTSGRFLGQYVMAVVGPSEIGHGFVLLLTKIIGSYAGMYTPSVDKRYSED